MSLSIFGSNNNNSLSSLQSLWNGGSWPGAAQASSGPLAGLLSELDQQGGGAAATTGASAPASSSGTSGLSGSISPQFGPQTLQALLALQAGHADPQSLASQFDGAASGGDPLSALQGQPSQGQQGHRHHHQLDADGSGGAGSGGQNPLNTQLTQMQAQLLDQPSTQSIATA